LKDFEEGNKNNTTMVIYEMVRLPMLLCGSESWTVLTGYECRFAGKEMYCRQTRRERIRSR
jgi:hypothetical protein